jgi:predicted nucleotidyltransferase
MNENLLDLSGKIDELTVSIYETIAKVADPAGIKYFIIGASARDMILKHGYGIHTIRATLDIDIGIQVSSWDDYKKLSSDLIEAGKFTKSKEPHRFLFNNTRIDLIPFGNIETEGNQISWPPEDDVVLNVLGFEEAYKSVIIVRLRSSPVLDIRVASLTGLTRSSLINRI